MMKGRIIMGIPPADPERDMPLGAMFKIIHLGAENYFNQNLHELNITASQMHVLMYLERCEDEGKTVNQRDIEKHLHLSNPTVTGLLQRLEAKGFVRRTVSETDGRNKEISQTGASRAIHTEMRRRLDLQNEKMVQGMSAEEIAELRRLLGIVLQNMRE